MFHKKVNGLRHFDGLRTSMGTKDVLIRLIQVRRRLAILTTVEYMPYARKVVLDRAAEVLIFFINY